MDPWADPDEVRHEYGVELAEINSDRRVDAVVVAVAHDVFKLIPLSDLRALCQAEAPVLADVKGLFNAELASKAGFTAFRL
jgi:UDP-N-acetyl-D-galactosamine dehydrogenase